MYMLHQSIRHLFIKRNKVIETCEAVSSTQFLHRDLTYVVDRCVTGNFPNIQFHRLFYLVYLHAPVVF